MATKTLDLDTLLPSAPTRSERPHAPTPRRMAPMPPREPMRPRDALRRRPTHWN